MIGTAGHVDHGKTSLLNRLSGGAPHADRLPEERQRGLTIDIGYAELHFGARKVGVVDVPGHEKFVHNMVAAASGIDLILLVVAADDGVNGYELWRSDGTEKGTTLVKDINPGSAGSIVAGKSRVIARVTPRIACALSASASDRA